MKKQKSAVILFSGGLDSTTVLYYALSRGYKCRCLIFDYGQRHSKEIKNAVKTAKSLKCAFDIVKIKLPWSNDALTNKTAAVPQKLPKKGVIPPTYVPGRNTLFLSYALSCAETLNSDAVFIGVNSVDFSNYPDCTPQFVKAYGNLLRALKTKISLKAPLLHMTKARIIKLGTKLNVPYEKTWSCYNGGQSPCGKCDSCRLRAEGFKDAGQKDPLTAINNLQLTNNNEHSRNRHSARSRRIY